jgi:hypothetical protein
MPITYSKGDCPSVVLRFGNPQKHQEDSVFIKTYSNSKRSFMYTMFENSVPSSKKTVG